MVAQWADRPNPSPDPLTRARETRERFAESYVTLPEGAERTIAGVRCRVFVPEGPAAAVYLHFHGGGMFIGAPEMNDADNLDLSRRFRLAVVSVDYRLAPEHPYPAGLDDCVAATRWVAAHAAGLGADGRRLAVAGDSAGASLAAGVSMLARDEAGPAVALQVLAYPAVDPAMDTGSYAENADDPFLSRDEMQSYWSLYLSGAEPDRFAAPALAPDLAGLPPAYVLVAGRDVLRDEGIGYAERLAAAGVAAALRRRDDMVHGFLLCTAWLDEAREAVAELAAALRAGLAAP